MRQIKNFGDERNKGRCVYCGGPNETRDHAPSRAFLDEPFPSELPVVPACAKCNASFAADEAYLTCLVECSVAGSIEAARARPKIDRILGEFPSLAARLESARRVTGERIEFAAEMERVRAIVVKLARGHVAFEQNEPHLDKPAQVVIALLPAMSNEQRAVFEKGSGGSVWPEVGSRALFRAVEGHDLYEDGWILVQPARYRYRVEYSGGLRVHLVIREYLAAEIVWT